jgi:hypothetical protein
VLDRYTNHPELLMKNHISVLRTQGIALQITP